MGAHRRGGRASLRAVAGFACNQGFVFSLFYLGSNRGLGDGVHVFERAELFGTLLFMTAAFVLLRLVAPRARDALLARPLVWCYAALLVVGSFVPLLVENPAVGGLVLECALLGLPAGCLLAAWGRALGREPIARSVPEVFLGSALGAAACFACAVVPVAGAVLVLKLLPLGSAAALRRLLAGPPVSVLAPAEGAATLLSGKIVAGTAVFGLAAGFIVGACLQRFGSKGGWILWCVWMAICFAPQLLPLDDLSLPLPPDFLLYVAVVLAAVMLIWSVWSLLHAVVKH